MQLHAELRRDLAGVDRVVGHGLQPLVLGPEGDRVGVDLLGGAVRQHGDDARVQAAGQEAGHRHVGDQVGGDRLLDDPAQVGRWAGGRVAGYVGDLPVMLDVKVAVRTQPGPGAGRELADALDRAELLGHPVVEHRRDQGARLDPQFGSDRGGQCLQFGGEQRAVASGQVEQGLDAERVAGQEQLAGLRVGQREREHAAELPQRVGSPAAPGLDHDLGVGVRDEPDAAAGQLLPYFLVVVQLAVVDHDQVVLDHRLVGGGGQVDDGQPPVAEVDADLVVLVGPDAAGVRAAVRDPVGHDVGELASVRLLVAACDAAHIQALVRRPGLAWPSTRL